MNLGGKVMVLKKAKVKAESGGLLLFEKEGVEIFSCGTCLAFYGIKDKLRIGKITNMPYTVDSLLSAAKVVTI